MWRHNFKKPIQKSLTTLINKGKREREEFLRMISLITRSKNIVKGAE